MVGKWVGRRVGLAEVGNREGLVVGTQVGKNVGKLEGGLDGL